MEGPDTGGRALSLDGWDGGGNLRGYLHIDRRVLGFWHAVGRRSAMVMASAVATKRCRNARLVIGMATRIGYHIRRWKPG
jgi:hypothetical protein